MGVESSFFSDTFVTTVQFSSEMLRTLSMYPLQPDSAAEEEHLLALDSA